MLTQPSELISYNAHFTDETTKVQRYKNESVSALP